MTKPATQQSAAGARPVSPAAEPCERQADPALMTIGELAVAVGVTSRALRFYQSKGLLAPDRDGNARIYSLADRNRLGLILQGKRLGFTLREIREILAAHDRDNSPTLPINRQRCAEQIKFLERQRQDLEQAICELRQIYSCLYRDLSAPDQSAARH